MGWTVIAKGQIDFPIGVENLLVNQVYSKMEKMKHGENGEIFYNLSKYLNEKDGGQIAFEMSGNKGIDYKPIKQIKSFILKELKGKNKTGLMINVGEYCETGDGFYFEYEKKELKS